MSACCGQLGICGARGAYFALNIHALCEVDCSSWIWSKARYYLLGLEPGRSCAGLCAEYVSVCGIIHQWWAAKVQFAMRVYLSVHAVRGFLEDLLGRIQCRIDGFGLRSLHGGKVWCTDRGEMEVLLVHILWFCKKLPPCCLLRLKFPYMCKLLAYQNLWPIVNY